MRLEHRNHQIDVDLIKLYPLNEQAGFVHMVPDQTVELVGKETADPADPGIRRFGDDEVVFLGVR